jgi:hypothetical protein
MTRRAETYLGKPCRHGHGRRGYRADFMCVVCKAERNRVRQAKLTRARRARRRAQDRARYQEKHGCAPRTYPRREALAKGRRTYIGKPCPHGHDGARYAISGCCIECVRAIARRRLTKKGRAHIRKLDRARERRKKLALETCIALGIPI